MSTCGANHAATIRALEAGRDAQTHSPAGLTHVHDPSFYPSKTSSHLQHCGVNLAAPRRPAAAPSSWLFRLSMGVLSKAMIHTVVNATPATIGPAGGGLIMAAPACKLVARAGLVLSDLLLHITSLPVNSTKACSRDWHGAGPCPSQAEAAEWQRHERRPGSGGCVVRRCRRPSCAQHAQRMSCSMTTRLQSGGAALRGTVTHTCCSSPKAGSQVAGVTNKRRRRTNALRAGEAQTGRMALPPPLRCRSFAASRRSSAQPPAD